MSTLAKLHVLVVEDHEFQRMVLSGMLEELGVGRVSEAGDGHEALSILGNGHAVDVIFLDLKMPGMDGVEFLRHLAPHSFGGSVVLASALEESLIESVRTLARMENIQVLGALEKPVTDEKIRLLLDAHVAEKPLPSYAADELIGIEEVRRGLREREMTPWYQPKVRFADGVITGVEALVRWQHPELGIIPPGSFLPVVEEHDLIDPLTEIVAQAAVRQCAVWQEAGLDLTVAINVAAGTVSRKGFGKWFAELTGGYGVAPEKLTIELTESALASDLSGCIGNLAQLRMHGFAVSIDDFGTGYSSMSQLKNLPFNELKIDRSFVSGITGSKNNQAIARGSVNIASDLGIRTTAEGVETWEEWDCLRDMGADLCQGYLSGKPVPAERMQATIDDWMSRHDARAGN